TVAGEKPMYRSIDYQLKNVLIQVGSEMGSPAPGIFAFRYVHALLHLKQLKSDYTRFGTVMEPVLSRTNFVAASLNALNGKQLTLMVRLFLDSESTAVDVVK